ncbi:MAG: lactoylglutathione lyase [Gammaproteobacteria bacterium]|jgi:lactoylglutathione lyase
MRVIRSPSGMTDNDGSKFYRLSFSDPRTPTAPPSANEIDRAALLELVERPGYRKRTEPSSSAGKPGYWKIGITLHDVDLARANLVNAGVQVSRAGQFLDIGYLCHLHDPDGHAIELLQHDFAENFQALESSDGYRLGGHPTLAHVTLRVRDPQQSLQFYCAALGLHLISRQIVEEHRFTLYFLATANERAPSVDIDSVANREWLWRRPYTVLELQHAWGTENAAAAYDVGTHTGFNRLTIVDPDIHNTRSRLLDLYGKVSELAGDDADRHESAWTAVDPDGYRIRLVDAHPMGDSFGMA